MKNLDTVGELDGQEDGMLDFVSYVGGSEVIVESFRVIFDHNLALSFGFVFPLDVLLF